MSGIFAICGKNKMSASLVYYALFALQHRGQYGCGIAMNDNGYIDYRKDLGYVDDVFDKDLLSRMQGDICLGTIDNSQKSPLRFDLDPVVMGSSKGTFAVAYDGSILNKKELIEKYTYLREDMTPSELLGTLMVHSEAEDLIEAIKESLLTIKGAFAMVLMSSDGIVAARDVCGIQVLSIGRSEDSFMVSSETCAIDALGGEFVSEVDPGYLYVLRRDGIEKVPFCSPMKRKSCLFEMIYFARPDSVINGLSVYKMRRMAGRSLAKTAPVQADMVIAAPDSGTVAAIGYADGSEDIPYEEGLIKNRYIGRTFIQPDALSREMAVKIKLNVLKENIRGKDVILVDDSIVRGTTMKSVVKMLKSAGAKKVHVRIASPLCKYPCKLGVNLSLQEIPLAAVKTIEEIQELIQSDSLAFIDVEELLKSTGMGETFCTGCFTGKYADLEEK